MPAFDFGAFDSDAFDALEEGAILLPLIDQSAIAFSPTLISNQDVVLGLIDQAAVAHEPRLGQPVEVGLISQPAAAFTPSLFFGIRLPLLNQSAVAHAPFMVFDQIVDLSRIGAFTQAFNPSVTGGFLGTNPGVQGQSTIVIRYDGTNITDDVVIVGAVFTSQANGTPGTCLFRIKDPEQDYTIVPGRRLTLDIDGERAWTGYVGKVSRVYAFAAMDTSTPGEVTRFLQIEGVDINILFKKRIVFSQANPKSLFGKNYAADNTPDTTAVRDLVRDFLDLSGDDIDTSTMVENVGTINVDQPANVIAPGYPWEATMRSIIALSSGVFYIDPDRRLVLTDVDTPSAPFDLSDDPADSAVGYRQMEVVKSASNMVNDCLIWGAGMGSADMVFSRETDATSLSDHGRWQYGEFRGDMYKQATVNRRADSIVQGSAQSKRGAKDDQVSVMCTVYEPGLRVADKVDFTSAAFGFQDVIPVRRMTISFVNPTTPRYDIVLSHEIDLPWGFFDIYRPRFPGFNIGPFPGWDIPDLPILDPLPGECTDAICGVTDDFEGRTVTGEFGTSTSGVAWVTQSEIGNVSADVASGSGFLYTQGSASGTTISVSLGGAVPNEFYTTWDTTAIKTLRFQWSNIAWTSSDLEYLVNWATVQREVGGPLPSIYRLGANGWRLRTDGSPTGGVAIPDGFWNDSTIYTWTVEDIGGGVIETAITDGTTTYSTTGAYTQAVVRCILTASSSLQSPFAASDRSFIILDVDVPEINRCDNNFFDTFNRTLSSGNQWGTSDQGYPWTPFNFNRTTASVSGTKGQFVLGTSGSGSWTGYQEVIPGFLPDQWDLYTEISMTSITDTLIYFSFGVNSGNFWDYYIRMASSGGQLEIDDQTGSLGTLAKTDWVAGAIYMLHAYYDGATGELKMSVWEKDEPEPAWMLEVTGTALEGPFDDGWFDIGINSNTSTTRTVAIDNVNFNYSGKPCFCADDGESELVVLDDFNRSLSNSWGTSSRGIPWIEQFVSTPRNFGVDGSAAYTNGPPDAGVVGAWLYDVGPFGDMTDFVWTWRARLTQYPPPAITAINLRVDHVGFSGFNLGLNLSSSGGPLSGTFFANGFVDSVNPSPVSDTDWYIFKIDSSVCGLKIWKDGDTEPSSWQWTVPPHTGSQPDRVFLVLQNPVAIDWMEVQGPSPNCRESGLSYGTGRVCEEFIGDGVTVTFETSQEQAYGLTSASIDGIRQYLLTGYSQQANVDSEIRYVTFTSAPAVGAHIRICYTVGPGALGLRTIS